MSNKETRIYKIIANIIRVCILLIFIIKFVMKSYDHIYNLLGVFIFSFYEKLLKKLNITRDTSSSPLFDTMFIYQNNGTPEVSLDGLQATHYIPDNHTSKFDFSE